MGGKDRDGKGVTDEDIEGSILARYFAEDVLSIHLKEGCVPMAKRGSVKAVELVDLDDVQLDREDLDQVLDQVLELASRHAGSSVEMERVGSVVVQLGPYRVAAAMPPFSDGMEVTAVRQVRQLELAEYGLEPALVEHLEDYHRGILVSGRPGDGKTTFARAVAMHLRSRGAVVKTMESPRDMVLPADVTQYAPLEGSWELTAEILLMVRPDFVVFDEVRKTEDFSVYADMRLAGVGLVGVVHANSAINAVQRLVGRVELGLLPQIVDTVLHLEKGEVAEALRLVPTVKVPEGMFEQDLARPVVVVEDFRTGEPRFEMYTYGDQLVVMPLRKEAGRRGRSRGVASRPQVDEADVVDRLRSLVAGPLEVEMTIPGRARVYVEPEDASAIIGRSGRTVRELEQELGVRIDVVSDRTQERGGGPARGGGQRIDDFNVRETKNNITLYINGRFSGRHAEVEVDGQPVGGARVTKRGALRFAKRSRTGKAIAAGIDAGSDVVIVL